MAEEDPLAVEKRNLIVARRVVKVLRKRKLPSLRNLQVAADSGTVTLSGSVESVYEKQLGLQTARLVNGVVRLVDHIELAPATASKDPMSVSRTYVFGFGFLLLAAIVALTATSLPRGEQRLPTFAVRGQVLFNGTPTAGAAITFHPREGGNDAPHPHGKVEHDGKFSLTTYEVADGAPPGEYLVTVEWSQSVGEGEDAHFVSILPALYSDPRKTKLVPRVYDEAEKNAMQLSILGAPQTPPKAGSGAVIQNQEVHLDPKLNLGD